MQSNIILWIGGVAVAAILGIYVYKASRKETKKILTPQNKSDVVDNNKLVDSAKPKPLNQMAAKVAFLNNISRFAPRLQSLCDGTYDHNDWVDDIIDINDDDLMCLWKKIHNDSKAIVRILSVWGLKPEMCTSFVCMDAHKDLYALTDGNEMEIGEKYVVKQPCWILTEVNSEGKSVKKVIVKGKVV